MSLRILLAVAALAVGARAEVQPVPETPTAVTRVIAAMWFTVAEPFELSWGPDAGRLESGLVLVLQVDPALVQPRQAAEPVLHVGNSVALRSNRGHEWGVVVALVPGRPDLAVDPVWFGTPRLPEQVTADIVAEERARARRAGIAPRPPAEIDAAFAEGGGPLRVADVVELGIELMELARRY